MIQRQETIWLWLKSQELFHTNINMSCLGNFSNSNSFYFASLSHFKFLTHPQTFMTKTLFLNWNFWPFELPILKSDEIFDDLTGKWRKLLICSTFNSSNNSKEYKHNDNESVISKKGFSYIRIFFEHIAFLTSDYMSEDQLITSKCVASET